MKANYPRSVWSAVANIGFDLPAVLICNFSLCLRCLWATAELQDSRLRGTSFQMGDFKFLPGTGPDVRWRTGFWNDPVFQDLGTEKTMFHIGPNLYLVLNRHS